MQRNKTQRRRGPATPVAEMSGAFGTDTAVKSTEDSLNAFFEAESLTTFQQPWQKLDRGSRLDRLRRFVQTYTPTEGSLTPAERASLLAAVLQAFELRQLNTKVAVEYDPVSATILTIRGLKERVTLTGLRTFRIEPPAASRTTQKRKSATVHPEGTTESHAT
jgi:hypothetical protein